MQKQPERLQKILSAYGVSSRRAAEKMILEGRILVNGIQATLGQSAQFGVDLITVDGVPIIGELEPVYIMLNKPCGYITTVSDEKDRKTVMSLVADTVTRVYPVGRLDINSEGLLLFTNDGEFANKIMHPSNEKEKVYEVTVQGDAQKALELLRQPVEIDGHTVRAVKVELVSASSNAGTLYITVVEGRNRQIRKMCTACGVRVKTLKRISVGTLMLGDLKAGTWRHLTKEEVRSLG